MRITILTLFPEIIESYLSSSIMKRSRDKNIVSFEVVNIRSFSIGAYNKVDDVVYGGGAGMLLMPGPVTEALMSVEAKGKKVILTSAKGKKFDQKKARELSKLNDIVIVAGHYEGIDERVREEFDAEELSVGDYVLTGGELPALIIADSTVRLIEDVISSESLEEESYSASLLEYPQYTRPETYCSKKVPAVLLSGHHRHIAEWRDDRRLENTLLNRPDMLRDASLSIEMRRKLIRLLDKANKD